jgi:hypothetical protein
MASETERPPQDSKCKPHNEVRPKCNDLRQGKFKRDVDIAETRPFELAGTFDETSDDIPNLGHNGGKSTRSAPGTLIFFAAAFGKDRNASLTGSIGPARRASAWKK